MLAYTCAGLTTYYVLTCMRVASRQVCIAGITTSPDQRWMEQMARNLSMAEAGFLSGLVEFLFPSGRMSLLTLRG